MLLHVCLELLARAPPPKPCLTSSPTKDLLSDPVEVEYMYLGQSELMIQLLSPEHCFFGMTQAGCFRER